MEGEAFFLDSYAIHEIAEQNPNYQRFAGNIRMATSKLNLMEVYYNYFSKKGEQYADFAFNRFRDFCLEIADDDLKAAMKWKAGIKLKNSKSNISHVDAVGYWLAKKHNLKFLTGDREFRGMENVEFVV